MVKTTGDCLTTDGQANGRSTFLNTNRATWRLDPMLCGGLTLRSTQPFSNVKLMTADDISPLDGQDNRWLASN
jgi:hypothetical protein